MKFASYKDTRTVQALDYIASRACGRAITKLVALKLLFLADRYHLRKYGRTILDDKYLAMPYGPVASHAKDMIDNMEKTGGDADGYISVSRMAPNRFAIRSMRTPDTSILSESEMEALDCATQQLFLRGDIVDFTHQFPEWKKHGPALAEGKKSIEMDYLDFFLPCEDAGTEYCDASENHVALSREVYQENTQWRL